MAPENRAVSSVQINIAELFVEKITTELNSFQKRCHQRLASGSLLFFGNLFFLWGMIPLVQLLLLLLLALAVPASAAGLSGRYLYVAEPGIRDYVEYGGHGLLVYDIDHGHKLVKRIPTAGVNEAGKPLNVKGICASITLKRVYITTIKTLMAVDLLSEKLLWEKSYDGGCDRLAISPDGKTIYVPSLEANHWNVVDAESGEVIHKIVTNSGAHNTILDPGQGSVHGWTQVPYLFVSSAKDYSIQRKVGPFGASIRSLTVNAEETLCFVNVNELLGFEVGNLHYWRNDGSSGGKRL